LQKKSAWNQAVQKSAQGGGGTKRREIGEIEPATETKCRVETQREKSINKWLKKMED
jgi:hypothetical protein